jgi:NAD(P)-dependent dehydrogenase (short-subunit alcohol dehydrogenase family)
MTEENRMGSDLSGRTALVTGASRGIGKAIATTLSARGASVALLARNETALKDTAAELGAETLVLATDVCDTAAVDAAVASAHRWHDRLDIVVNCAGPQLSSSPLGETGDDALAGALDTKLQAFLRVTRAALPLLSTTGTGSVVNIAGATAHTPLPGTGVSGITNAAVVALTGFLATEGAARGIRVNAVSPGMTLTEGWLERHEGMAAQQGKTADEVRAGMVAGLGIRLGRWARTDEIAAAVAFLASDDATYITGQVLRVDGGLTKQVA